MTQTDTLLKVVLEENYALVSYNPVLKIGKVEWKAKASSEEYQAAIIALIEYAEKHPVHYYLADITKQSVVSPEDRKWFENIMVPKAIGMGLKKAAVVFDGNVFKKYYVNMIIQVTGKLGLPLKLFNKEEDAIQWFLK
ncbi:MAG: STAS/SEC14 domain-containing protein [Bacteroidales bacterium]|nr:STAS/SEC14 domain-containing protein [Bacteroidales bacterium]